MIWVRHIGYSSLTIAIVVVFLFAWLLTSPLSNTKQLILRWFRSDQVAFFSIIFFSFLFVVIITWLHLFSNALILLAAEALARLDLQTQGYKKWKAFGILALVSLGGLIFGLALRFFLIKFL
jgi:hypothetical protein